MTETTIFKCDHCTILIRQEYPLTLVDMSQAKPGEIEPLKGRFHFCSYAHVREWVITYIQDHDHQ